MSDDLDALYAIDPESFTAARDALAKQLKAAGDAAAATSVKALRRPSVAAWLLNLTARERPDAVSAVIELAAQLRAAQTDAISGRGADALRALTAARRRIVGDAVQAAQEIAQLRGRAVTQPVIDAMTGTVEAALADASLAERWQGGTLVTAEHAVGFSFEATDFALAASAALVSDEMAASEVATAEESTDLVDADGRVADLHRELARAQDLLATAAAEAERQKAVADAAEKAARLARVGLKEALRAQAKAELVAATAEQALWEATDRSRRDG